MKKTKRAIAFLLSLITAFSVFLSVGASASALNVCSEISGTAQSPRKFSVSTKNRFFGDKITFTQEKGSLQYYNGSSKSIYAHYTVRIDKIDGGNRKADHRTVEWRGTRTLTISLQKNAEYSISILPYNLSYYHVTGFFSGGAKGWNSYPTWRISKTKGVEFCY